MNEEQEMVTITKAEYEQLLKDSAWLNCLEGSGVDNWCGLDFAYEIFEEEYPEYAEQ